MLVIGLIFYILSPQLAGIFTKTIEVQEMIISVLRLIAWFQPFAVITQVITSALQGAGDSKFPMYDSHRYFGNTGWRWIICWQLFVIWGL